MENVKPPFLHTSYDHKHSHFLQGVKTPMQQLLVK